MALVKGTTGQERDVKATAAPVRKKFSFTVKAGTLNVCKKNIKATPQPVIISGKNSDMDNITTSYISKDGNTYVEINVYIQKRFKTNYNVSLTIGDWIKIGSAISIKLDAKSQSNSYSSNGGGGGTSLGDDNSSSTSSTGSEEEVTITSATFDVTKGANALNFASNEPLTDLMSDSMHGIFGIPYQWMSIADRRLDGSEFGRKYAEKIAARMPLLFLTPCRPAFLNGANKDQKKNILSAFWSKASDNESGLVDTLLGDTKDSISKFYTANFAYEEYYSYVNVFCQTTAKLLHLDGSAGSPTATYGVAINGTTGKKAIRKFDKYNWATALSKGFTEYFSSASAIPFYINANVSVSESISNDTEASALAGTVKSQEQKAKELNYLLNTAGGASKGLIGDITSWVSDLTNKWQANSTASTFMGSIANSMSSIAAGGSMMFPELWSSSSVGRSYQIDIKLRSPDGDALSVYLNVLVPLYHLLCLAAPQMLNSNYNVYYSPFIIKAYCKSMFNIDMGIITSMDISKGKEGDWNANGIPTSIDVSLTIKDLYDVFSITPYDTTLDLQLPFLESITSSKSSSARRIIRNTAMMDYICNNAGLNLNQNEIGRQITVYKLLRENNILNWPENKWLQLQQTVDSTLAKIYRPSANNR